MSEQPPYGAPEPPRPNPYDPGQPYAPYGAGPGGVPYGPPPDHPQATTVLIFGVLGLAVCGLLAPFAWIMGTRALREIDASQGRIGGRSQVNIGRILGIVGSVLLAIGLLFVLVYVVVIIAAIASSA